MKRTILSLIAAAGLMAGTTQVKAMGGMSPEEYAAHRLDVFIAVARASFMPLALNDEFHLIPVQEIHAGIAVIGMHVMHVSSTRRRSLGFYEFIVPEDTESLHQYLHRLQLQKQRLLSRHKAAYNASEASYYPAHEVSTHSII